MIDKSPSVNLPQDHESEMAEIDAEIERETIEASETFDALYADYLEARAKTIRPSKTEDIHDATVDAAIDEMDKIMWRVIHTPAPAIRAHLAEFGIVAAVGRKGVEQLLAVVTDASDQRVLFGRQNCDTGFVGNFSAWQRILN